MKTTIPYIARNLSSILCILAAFGLALANREGWGWFLFIAAICWRGKC